MRSVCGALAARVQTCIFTAALCSTIDSVCWHTMRGEASPSYLRACAAPSCFCCALSCRLLARSAAAW